MRTRMVMVVAVAVVAPAALAGCGFNNNPGSGDDAGIGSNDGGTDGPLEPCVLPDLGMTVDTLAGCSDAGTLDGPRGVARFSNPVNVALGPSGIAYVADFDSSLLRKIDLDGNVTTIFKDPRFNRPFGMLLAPDGWLYVECDNDVNDGHGDTSGTIWKINPANPYATGGATPVVMNMTRPRGLVMIGGNQIAVTDYVAMELRIVNPAAGTSTLLAGAYGVTGHIDGKGGGATFNQPWDLVVDPAGGLIVTDFANNTLRHVSLDGTVTLYGGATGVAGSADGPLAQARFNGPKGMSMDASGAIYITDSGNHTIRKLDHGMVTTISGTLEGGYRDAPDPMAAAYYGIEGLDVSPDGKRMVIADGNNGDGEPFNHVRVITLP